jgi:hypothetical protein
MPKQITNAFCGAELVRQRQVRDHLRDQRQGGDANPVNQEAFIRALAGDDCGRVVRRPRPSG